MSFLASFTASTVDYAYNAADELTDETTTVGANTTSKTYAYDDNGAQTSITANSIVTPYAYDFEGKLVSVGDATSSTRSSYVYDGDGNRLSAIVTTGGVAKTVRYLNDTNTAYVQVLEERDENGALQARYDYGDMDLQKLYRRDANGSYLTRWYLNDGLESTRQLVDANGVVTDSYAYDAFGTTLQRAGETENTRLFNGQQQDESSLYFLRARYYNTGNGRFLSHDPLLGNSDDPVTLHRYLYANASPTHFVDPSGQESIVSVAMTTAINAIVQNVSQNVVMGAANLFANSLVYSNFMGDYGQHLVNGGRGPVPDGIMIASQGQAGYSVLSGSLELGIYVDLERFFADGVVYSYGAQGLALGTVGFGSKSSRSLGAALGLTFNTYDPALGRTNPARLNGYAFNATWPLPLAEVIMKANPAFKALKAAGTLLPLFRAGGVSMSVSANGDILERQGPTANFDGAAVISYTSTGQSPVGLSTGVSYSEGFGSPIPVGQLASRGIHFGAEIVNAAARIRGMQ